MVDEFVQSGMAAHTQSDHPYHNAPIMGGMCGFHAPQVIELTGLKTWADFMAAGNTNLAAVTGGADQLHLYHAVWKALHLRMIHHRLQGVPGVYLHNVKRELPKAVPPDVPYSILNLGDALSNFMGDAGFDVPKAVAFYDTYGRVDIAERARKAELCPV